MTIILQCPVCRNPLLNSADGFQCSRGHAFDASREGYVNLLLAHKKNSREPGDNKDMILSRTRFLNLGLYNAISDGINEAAASALAARGDAGSCNILDAGCGEGFYLQRLREFLVRNSGARVPFEYYGVDISKFAVRQAARRDRTLNWFVAGVKDLPFAQSSFGLLLNVFSPADIAEFARVLEGGGGLVTVSPGPKHLNGLREIIYPRAREHAAPKIRDEMKELFVLSGERRINYLVELKTREAVQDLLAMTPYYWNIDLATKARVESLNRLSSDVDVEVRIFRKLAA